MGRIVWKTIKWEILTLPNYRRWMQKELSKYLPVMHMPQTTQQDQVQ